MAKFAISRQNSYIGTGTESGYQFPLDRGKVVPVPIKWYQYPFTSKRVGTGTDASSSLDFCTLSLLSPNSYTDSIGTLINY